MKTAIVTLAIGNAYLDGWRTMCEPGWRAYAQRHGYDLLVIDKPLDSSPRAASRSPAWQKCLVLGDSVAMGYDRVVWIDSDILINPAAPAIAGGVPIKSIGVVDEHNFPSVEARQRVIRQLADRWQRVDAEVARTWETFLDPAEWHAFAGLPKRGQHIIQTGVMVLSPAHHRNLLQHVYDRYEDMGGDRMNYEMRPLSFEIQERNLQHWIDSRFNALAGMMILLKEMEIDRKLDVEECRNFLVSEYHRNYFLHFAGRHKLMALNLIPGPVPES